MRVRNNTKQKPESSTRPTSARKHEVLRKPTARNAIVRDEDTGTYTANVDALLANTLTGMSLRINALELELSQLKRGDAVDRGYAQPLPSNVVPMDGARKAKEQSKAAPVSHPLPVAGNEAHVLPVPEPTVTIVAEAPPLKVADVEPKHLDHTRSTLRAAANDDTAAPTNDECLIPDDTKKLLRLMTNESDQDMEALAEAYGMDIVEASRVLFKHYSRAEAQCYKDHGVPRDDVKAARFARQSGVVETNPALQRWHKSKHKGFASWDQEIQARLPHLRAVSKGTVRKNTRSITDRAPLTKGEAKYRRRIMLRSVASRRERNGPGLSHIQDVHRKLYAGGVPVTTASQAAAITTWGYSIYTKARKLLRMQPVVRNAWLASSYQAGYDAEHGTGPPPKAQPTVTIDVNQLPVGGDITQAELVRRSNRTGIGY